MLCSRGTCRPCEESDEAEDVGSKGGRPAARKATFPRQQTGSGGAPARCGKKPERTPASKRVPLQPPPASAGSSIEARVALLRKQLLGAGAARRRAQQAALLEEELETMFYVP